MRDYEKELQDILNEVAELENRMKEVQEEMEKDTRIGNINLIEGKVQLELFIQKDLFNEEQMEKFKKIADELQLLLLDIEKDLNE